MSKTDVHALPQRIYITTVPGTKQDARDYARQWLAGRQSVEGWYQVETLAPNNQLIEVHDGGDGHSHINDLIRRFRETEGYEREAGERPPSVNAMVLGVEKAEVLSLSRTGLSKLSVDPEEFDREMALKSAPGRMAPYQANPGAPFLMAGIASFVLAAIVLGLAIAAKPVPEPITLVASDAPPVWNEWSERIRPMNETDPEQVRFVDNEWTWESAK